jgi:hypothetical protein
MDKKTDYMKINRDDYLIEEPASNSSKFHFSKDETNEAFFTKSNNTVFKKLNQKANSNSSNNFKNLM